ncbi:hypothetical protein F5X96DRAFT_645328 [Biscogniauxia mediterranea]|nr:hypothetical protein F5X96DRAFT_645328 [Biscogniauxia mediterranea]
MIARTRASHPVYSDARGNGLPHSKRWHLSRKYGKYDFGRFEHLHEPSHYLGRERIGDIDVACKFLCEDSKWGVLTHENDPGGVVYLDLQFTEPPGCRLKSASIILTLDDEDIDLQRQFGVQDVTQVPPRVPVQITTHGPKLLQGPSHQILKTERHSAMPNIEVGGLAGFGGLGKEAEKKYIEKDRWRFSSQVMSNQRGKDTSLRWDLSECELERKPSHGNTFHTGFSFRHDGQPFFMQVQVSGTLESVTSHMRHKAKETLKKFKFPREPQCATTLVNFGGRNNPYKTPLDEMAQGIPDEMLLKNIASNIRAEYPSMKPRPQNEDSEADDNISVEVEEPSSTDQPSLITNAEPLESVTTQEIQDAVAAIMSLDQSPPKRIQENRTTEISPTPPYSKSNEAEVKSPTANSHENTLSISSNPDEAQKQNEESRDVVQVKPLARYEEIQRLLGDNTIPPIIQVIILWLLEWSMRPGRS